MSALYVVVHSGRVECGTVSYVEQVEERICIYSQLLHGGGGGGGRRGEGGGISLLSGLVE